MTKHNVRRDNAVAVQLMPFGVNKESFTAATPDWRAILGDAAGSRLVDDVERDLAAPSMGLLPILNFVATITSSPTPAAAVGALESAGIASTFRIAEAIIAALSPTEIEALSTGVVSTIDASYAASQLVPLQSDLAVKTALLAYYAGKFDKGSVRLPDEQVSWVLRPTLTVQTLRAAGMHLLMRDPTKAMATVALSLVKKEKV